MTGDRTINLGRGDQFEISIVRSIALALRSISVAAKQGGELGGAELFVAAQGERGELDLRALGDLEDDIDAVLAGGDDARLDGGVEVSIADELGAQLLGELREGGGVLRHVLDVGEADAPHRGVQDRAALEADAGDAWELADAVAEGDATTRSTRIQPSGGAAAALPSHRARIHGYMQTHGITVPALAPSGARVHEVRARTRAIGEHVGRGSLAACARSPYPSSSSR